MILAVGLHVAPLSLALLSLEFGLQGTLQHTAGFYVFPGLSVHAWLIQPIFYAVKVEWSEEDEK